jgi:PAS domain S-box-containing protein
MFIFLSGMLLFYSLTNTKITTIEEVNKKLQDTSLVVEDLIKHSPDPMCMCDTDGTIINVKDSFLNTFDLKRETTIGKINIFIYNFNFDDNINNLFNNVTKGETVHIDSVKKNSDDKLNYFSLKLYPTFSSDNKISKYILLAEDITERKNAEDALKKAYDELEMRVKERTIELSVLNEALQNEIFEHKIDEEKIKASLKEKDVLLKEIHHRVKNNMQIISSMLGLQSNFTQEKAIINMLKDSQNRIKSMALIHEKLYQSNNMAAINFPEYVNSLISNLNNSYNSDIKNISIVPNVENVSFNIDLAIPLGLIINELISNSFKHAFSDRTNGEIILNLNKLNDNYYRLEIRDNGIGFPEEFNINNLKSLGLQLVTVLVEQINGKLIIEQGNGSTFLIEFPV